MLSRVLSVPGTTVCSDLIESEGCKLEKAPGPSPWAATPKGCSLLETCLRGSLGYRTLSAGGSDSRGRPATVLALKDLSSRESYNFLIT